MSLEFASIMFSSWLSTKDIGHISASLKRAKLDDELMVCTVGVIGLEAVGSKVVVIYRCESD